MSDALPPEWAQPYVVIPYVERGRDHAGADCWGVTRLVLMEHFGFTGLPSFAECYESSLDKDAVSAVVEEALTQGWERRDEPFAGALIILQIAGRPWHCGVMLNSRWMLHSLPKINTVCERIDSLTWGKRIVGFYRAA